MSDGLKKVRMLVDWPPDEPRWKAGDVREVDAARYDRLLADGNAEDASVERAASEDTPAPAKRQPRRGRS
jgi:hypothetical protein